MAYTNKNEARQEGFWDMVLLQYIVYYPNLGGNNSTKIYILTQKQINHILWG